jgi:dolichyl-phosphate-mannose-protein mannosyltransferase
MFGPLTPGQTAILAATLFAAILLRRTRVAGRTLAMYAVVAAVLLAARAAVTVAMPAGGWMASYYANESWSGAPQWSSDFPQLPATRIDQAIVFRDDTFPAYYLNDASFDRGIRREVSEPMSITWRGSTFVEAARSQALSLAARGTARLDVDGRTVLRVSSPGNSSSAALHETEMMLGAGWHDVTLQYMKPAGADGLIELRAPGMDVLQARSSRPAAVSASRWAQAVIDAALIVLLIWAGVHVTVMAAPFSHRQLVTAGLFALFGIQGFWRARPLATHIVTLTSGDDWFGFESSAREILHHGPLMTFGRPLGEGAAYFFHPLYCYFLAAVHLVTGESLFGPVFIQFVILAGVATLLWGLAADLFGERPALAGVAALLVILELDFTRYYTVTLLSENLYVLTITLALVPFVRWVGDGRWTDLARAGFWSGVSSITRPAMMMYFVPALVLIAFVASRRRWSDMLPAAALTAGLWGLVIAPVTLRNWIVAHRFVLISDGLGESFIKYNLPPSVDPSRYLAQFHGGVASGLRVLARIAWDHPLDVLAIQGKKLGFSLGMIQWFDGYRPHPELVAVTLLYIATCMGSKAMRARTLWPVHLFVLAHLASMGLTMPWNYGYRLIIPPFVLTSVLSASAACSIVAVWLSDMPLRRPTESKV